MPNPSAETLLRARIAELDAKVQENNGLARAIQAGEVDAVVVLQKNGANVYRIQSDEPLYRTVVEELPQGVATILPDGTVVYANRHLISSMSAPERFLGSNLVDCVVERDRPIFRAMLRRALDSRQELETTLLLNGVEAPVLVSAVRMPVEGVEAIGLAVTDLRDQHARKAAEEASRVKDELLASVSHELRTPLASMMGWVQLLEMEFKEDERVSDALNNLKNAVLAETAIVEDLLDLSRSTRGSLPIDLRAFDVREALQTAVTFVKLQARNKSIALRSEISSEPLPVRGDPDRLRQVFVNLLSNAVKFTDGGGSVDFTATREDGSVKVVVRDTGIGIDRDFVAYVFEPFRRGSDAEHLPGLGIGLAIARSLVEAHGGVISATSDGPGLGAVFTVQLPLDAG